MGVASLRAVVNGEPCPVCKTQSYERAIPSLEHAGSPTVAIRIARYSVNTGTAMNSLGRTDKSCSEQPFASLVE